MLLAYSEAVLVVETGLLILLDLLLDFDSARHFGTLFTICFGYCHLLLLLARACFCFGLLLHCSTWGKGLMLHPWRLFSLALPLTVRLHQLHQLHLYCSRFCFAGYPALFNAYCVTGAIR